MPSVESNNFSEPMDGDKIVISGISGLYPKCHNVKELSDVLYNKLNPVTSDDCRWKYNHPELINYVGKVPDIDLFDAQFFKVHYRLSHKMDPMSRKVLEQAYQAIYDAGVSPEHLNGKKIGVYLGSGFSETEKAAFFDETSRNGFGLTGCNKSMFANRISYWLNGKGPSMCIDQACCSSFAALEAGYQAVLRGDCEAAIVSGTNLCLHPQTLLHYNRILNLSPDGKTRSFDTNANGCARSEAISVLFLQRAKDALRVYAEVVYVKSEFTSLEKGDTGPKYGFYRNPSDSINFLNNFYHEANVSPQAVKYVEAFGSGIPDADKSELETLDAVFCRRRKEPLSVGSVTSNIGYSESASGFCSIAKVLLGYNSGKIAANLHCDSPRQDVDVLKEGRIQIVTTHQPMDQSYAAVNGYSFNGINAHVLLKGHNKPKDLSRYKSNIPHLVTVSGRQESSVTKVLQGLKSHSIDPEELALLHNIHETRISGHLERGYAILDTNDTNETVCVSEKISYFDDATRPLWFVYSGMGSQWSGMGTQLMTIPTFAAAIERCQAVLKPKGVDLVNIITSPDPCIFDSILNSFVGIAAIQIGLTNILRELGIVPDKIIGHSAGELGCAYADGGFTAEEMILTAYYRGLISIETPFIYGSMAAVGIGYQEISKLIPPGIEVGCHNSSTSCTISGPADLMKSFVDQLTSQNIFAKEVPCSNIAYHSKYIADAGPGLLKYLKKLITKPKLRTKRWVSTSVPQDRWDEDSALYCSAEYHTNNLLRPVLFEEMSKLIPPNAVLVEIAPHGLLQAILKRSLPSCKNIPLTKRANPNGVGFLLEAIGELYICGYNPKVKALYPKVEFPVSNGTPMLSHLVDWAHNEKWQVPLYVAAEKQIAAACNFVISVHDEEHAYLKGHVIKEKNVYPFAAALVAVWDTMAMSLNQERKKLSVQFSDVHFYSQPFLNDHRRLKLSVTLQRGTGRFEVLDHETEVISGVIKEIDKDHKKAVNNKHSADKETTLSADDIYKLFCLRGYNYAGDFHSIYNANFSLTKAKILWRDSWETFIDAILQLNFLRQPHSAVSQLMFIKKIEIDLDNHIADVGLLENGPTIMAAEINDLENSTRCGGILLENIRLQDLPATNNYSEAIRALKFIPHFSSTTIDEELLLNIYLQGIVENLNKDIINVLKINNGDGSDDLTYLRFKNVIRLFGNQKIKFSVINRYSIIDTTSLKNIDLALVQNLSTDDILCQLLHRVINTNTFIINEEYCPSSNSVQRPSLLYRIISAHSTGNKCLELIRWRPSTVSKGTCALSVNSLSDLPLLLSTVVSIPQKQNLIVVSCYPSLPKLKDIVKDCRKKTNKNIFLTMIDKMSMNKIESLQLKDDVPDFVFSVVVDNTLGGEYWLPIKGTLITEGRMILENTCANDINSLKWVNVSEETGAGIQVKVHYAGLSILDAKIVSGINKSRSREIKNVCGMEFSGLCERTGSRVMGLVKGGAVSTKILANPNMIWPVPRYWNLEDAATVPLAYSLALYCLCIKSHLYSGMRIFVHGGSGALGQAIISIALAHNCEVFTTVSSIKKKLFLRKLFPELKDDHIGNSRNQNFSHLVLAKTKGEGCDIIISTVKGELRSSTLKCCAPSGITIDTTLIPDQEDYNLGMDFMFFSRAFATVDLHTVFASENENILKQLQELVSEGITRGYVRPLSRVTYQANDAPQALRLLSGSRHLGRVLLDLKQLDPVVQARLKCSPELNHLVLADDDGLGIQLTERLISRGAKKIYLYWKNPSNLLEFKASIWKKMGVVINILYEDILDESIAEQLFKRIADSGPIEGIYLLAIDNNYASNMENILTKMKVMSREFNPCLRYSVIMKVDKSNEEKRCYLRPRFNQKPITVELPKLKEFCESLQFTNADLISVQDAIDAVEFALSTPPTSLVALSWSVPQIPLWKKIVTLTGIDNDSKINDLDDVTLESKTLKELGMDSSMAESVQAYMRDYYGTSRSKDDILGLTVLEIKKLEKEMSSQIEYEETNGISTFISYLDKDELQASSKMIQLPTLFKSEAMHSEELDVNQKYLFVIPGIEGHHERLRIICERLKQPALVLLPGFEKRETIHETAQRLVQTMPRKAVEVNKRFHLLGYESGVFTALEMASILEEQGFTGTVFCVGGSPDDISNVINEKLNEYDTEEALQNAILKHMAKLMTQADTSELNDKLENALTWPERVESYVEVLQGRVGYSKQFTREITEYIYFKIKQLRYYKSEPRALQSLLVSLRPRSSGIQNTSSCLQRYSKQAVIEYDIDAPFAHIAEDLQCSAIINRHLDKDILDAFKKSNLCDTYLINEGVIIKNT